MRTIDGKTLTEWNEWTERVFADSARKDPNCLLFALHSTLEECEVYGQWTKRP